MDNSKSLLQFPEYIYLFLAGIDLQKGIKYRDKENFSVLIDFHSDEEYWEEFRYGKSHLDYD